MPNHTFTALVRQLFFTPVFLAAAALAAPAARAEIVAFDMVGSADQNLVSYSNPSAGAFSNPGDGFQKYQRGVSPSIPFAVLDDSLSIFPGDALGIVKEGNTDVFFGVTDTVNGDNSDPVSATWVFDVSGSGNLILSVDVGAMGDFETSDFFEITYSFDGGAEQTAFASAVDEATSQTYTLEGGAMFTLNDPMTLQGTLLSNDFATFSAPLTGSGSQLTITLTASTDGGSEAFAFQNLVIEGAPAASEIAFDMVGSGDLNLVSYTNPFTDAFGSNADGFQKYQRFVSADIPFSVLDDSLSIFTGDNLGIVKEGNTDVFFGVTDTVNGDNSGPVSATWVFDVSGAAGAALALQVDVGAMGDFETSDTFEWTYRFDAGPVETAFASEVDEATSQTYTLEGGAMFTLNDPMTLQGTLLSNDFATFTAPLSGTGTQLTVTLTASTDGGTEAFAFQNLKVVTGIAPPPPPPGPVEAEIFEIQGDGASSPLAGEEVVTRGNVVTALAPNGFFMQTPAARSDGDGDTSDGIFVFTGAAPAVAVGDLVDVTGEVVEFFGLTEIEASEVVVVGTGAVPAAIVFDATVPSPDPMAPSCMIEFECYEGMLVAIAGGTVTGPNQSFGSDPLAEVYITAAPARTFREPGIEFPGLPGLPEWDGNPEVFELDPDKLGLPNQAIPAGSSFDAVGVIGFEFGGYELWPVSLTVTEAALPVAVRAPEDIEMTVGALNLFRLFDDVDDPPVDVSVPEAGIFYSIDDTVVSSEEYARRLAKLSAYVRDVLGAPDVLAVSEVEGLNALQGLADRIAADDAGIVYTAWLEEGNDRGGIDVGFLVRDTVVVDAVTQLARFEILDFDGSLLHDRPPLLLEARQVAGGSDFPVAVLALHNRSLGGIDDPADGERVRAKRLAQAESVAAIVQSLQDADPDINLVVAGDFNAFEFSDGYVDATGIMQGAFEPADSLVCQSETCDDLVEPNLLNAVTLLPAGERYSFIFGGSAQVLDHALTSSGLDELLRDFRYGRANADAALLLLDDETTPLRASDHDGFVLYLAKDSDGDGVLDDADACPATVIPEGAGAAGVGVNRFALADDDRVFDTTAPEGVGPGRGYDIFDTAGCSCEQIVAEQGLGRGHLKFGCSQGAMQNWVEGRSPR